MSDTVSSVTIITSSIAASGVIALERAAHSCNIGATIVLIDDPQAVDVLNGSKNVIYRLGPKSYSKYMQLTSRLTNTNTKHILASVLRSFDKIEIARVFKEASVDQPVSWVIKRHEAPVKFPVIIKIRHGNKGKGVGLLKSLYDYTKFIEEFPNELDYLLQEYIESAVAEDKRIFVVGDTVVAAMKRTSAGDDFRTNLHAGGSAVSYVPTSEEVRLAVKAAKAFNLQYGGVDIIDSPNGPLVLEVNPSPGFAISKITGIDVAQKVILGVIND
jgi:RimK family alpha-L-glutamate ligase